MQHSLLSDSLAEDIWTDPLLLLQIKLLLIVAYRLLCMNIVFCFVLFFSEINAPGCKYWVIW